MTESSELERIIKSWAAAYNEEVLKYAQPATVDDSEVRWLICCSWCWWSPGVCWCVSQSDPLSSLHDSAPAGGELCFTGGVCVQVILSSDWLTHSNTDLWLVVSRERDVKISEMETRHNREMSETVTAATNNKNPGIADFWLVNTSEYSLLIGWHIIILISDWSGAGVSEHDVNALATHQIDEKELLVSR